MKILAVVTILAIECNGLFGINFELTTPSRLLAPESAKRKTTYKKTSTYPVSMQAEAEYLAMEPKRLSWAGNRELTTTVVVVGTQDALIENLHSNTTINLGDDIFLYGNKANFYTGIVIDKDQESLVIDGLGLYKVDGQSNCRCFYMTGSDVNVVIQNLEITKGVSQDDGIGGGGVYIYKSEVHLVSCTITTNSGSGEVSVGGALFMNFGFVSLVACSVTSNGASRGGGIDIDHGQLLLVGCLFSGNSALIGKDLHVKNGSDVTVLSLCLSDSYHGGQGTLKCAGCSTTYPADLLSGNCTACPTLAPFSCCGARDKGECTITSNSTVCSENENYVCSVIPAPTPAPSMTPTRLPVITAAPTSLHVKESSYPTYFTVLVGGATTVAIVFVIFVRGCLCRTSPSKRTSGYNDFVSPFLGGPQNNVDFDYAPEYIYADHIDDTTKDSKDLPNSQRILNAHEIASTYGAEQTFKGSSEHDPGEYDHDTVPFDVLISHLNRHGLEVDVAEEVAVYFSVSFGVQSVGDFRLLEEADIEKAAENLELLKIPASRLRIAWR